MIISSGEIWLVNLDPTMGDESVKSVRRLSSAAMPLASWRCASWFP